MRSIRLLVAVAGVLLLRPAPAAGDEGAALVFRWQRLPGAAVYDIEIAEDRAFAKVVVRETVSVTEYRWHTLARRPHYWRVRGVDADGRKGVFSAPRVIGAVVGTPQLAAPAAGQRIGHGAEPPTVRLRWQRGGEALARYDLQVARDAAFTDVVLSRRVTGTEQAFRPPGPGRYHWRVGGIDLHGQVVAPGDAREFVVFVETPRAVAPREGTSLPWAEGGVAVTLEWQPRPVRGFQVQVATDPAFKQLVVRERVPRTALSVRAPARGGYFWRVRGVEPETAWSPRGGFQIVLATPEPEAPAEGGALAPGGAGGRVDLRWRPVPGARAYVVEVTPVPAPGEVPPSAPAATRQRRTPVPHLTWEGLPPGSYRWTVRAVDEADVPSGASAPRRFTIGAGTGAGAAAPASGPASRPGAGPRDRGLDVGARVGVFHNLGEVTTARMAVQARYRPPILRRRLGAALAVGYYTATAGTPAGGGLPAVDSRLHGVPLELVLFYVQPLRVVDLYVGVGLDVSLLRSRVSADTQPTWERTGVELGGLGVVGAERGLGPGRLYVEVAYERASRSTGLLAMDPGGISASLGYRVGVW
jgi:hypothetical protein